MLFLLRFFLCLPIVFCSAIFSQKSETPKKRRIAILPITSNKPNDADAQYAGEIIRSELTAAAIFDVVANDQVESQLKIIEKKQKIGSGSCNTKECAIDVGNALESELMFAGKLVKNSTGSVLISGRVINVVSQKEEYSAVETAASVGELEKMCKALVLKLNLWVTDAKFMKELKEKEAEAGKAKLSDQTPKSPGNADTRFREARTLVRLGLVSAFSAGETMKNYFSLPIGANLDFFLLQWGSQLKNIALYLHGGWRMYFVNDLGKSVGYSANKMQMFDGGVGLRFGIGFNVFRNLLQPYAVLGGKFNYVQQSATGSDGVSSLSITYTGIGVFSGLGLEFAIYPSFIAIYLETVYGYSPVGKSKENIDGIIIHGGVTLRL